jgi:hypothetical protein
MRLRRLQARKQSGMGEETGCLKFYLAYRTYRWHNAAPDGPRTHAPQLSVLHRCRGGQMVYMSAEGA